MLQPLLSAGMKERAGGVDETSKERAEREREKESAAPPPGGGGGG